MTTTSDVIHALAASGLIAVVRTDSAGHALDVAGVLSGAGVKAIEVTFTVPQAESVIRELAATLGPDTLVGAGTVRTRCQAEAAVQAGARFLVSPGLPPEKEMYHLDGDVPFIPGILTPTELMAAQDAGAQVVKLFPASFVGPQYLTALLAPFPGTAVIPTGGIGPTDAKAWIRAGAAAVGMGGPLSPPEFGDQASRDDLRNLAAVVLRQIDDARLTLVEGTA